MDRASAVIILNSTSTGRPEAILEGSTISAKRTAASAALAAHTLLEGKCLGALGIIGCGLINYETARFIHLLCPEVNSLCVFDLDRHRAAQFSDKCASIFEHVEVAEDLKTVTSIHLAEQLAGNRGFVRCSLGEILLGHAPARRDAESITIFSPFGLGILDIALAKLVCELGTEASAGTVIDSFLPSSWLART